MSLNKRKILYCLISLLLVSGILSGCASGEIWEQETPTDSGINSDTSLTGTPLESNSDDRFTLVYDSGSSLNPYSSDSEFNLQLSGLMYESLFSIDESFNAQQVLCKAYTTADGINYTFELKSGIKFWNGADFNAYDAVYSINLAKSSDKYSSRLSCISQVQVTDELTFSLTLTKANMSLPALLDIPIVEYDTGYSSVPGGTGPYQPQLEGETPCLVSNTLYRDKSLLPTDTIYLYSYSSLDSLVSSFISGGVDLVTTDETNPHSPGYGSGAEKTRYDTTVMHYIGFNSETGIFSESTLRHIFSQAINRESIAESVFGGVGRPTSLPVNPCSSLYNASIAQEYDYKTGAFAVAVKTYGFKDINNDGYLEYLGSGGYTPFSISFIVNEEDTAKVAAAEFIASDLSAEGINVILEALPWEEYCYRLESGNFDMYYGEVRLSSDFDLSCLLAVGGSANYGVTNTAEYGSLINSFLAASAGAEKDAASKALYEYIGDNSPIVPIMFEQSTVVTHWKDIDNLTPVQDNIFYNITGWVYK